MNKNGLEKKKSFSKKFLTKAGDVDKIINVAEKKAIGIETAFGGRNSGRRCDEGLNARIRHHQFVLLKKMR